MSVDVERRTTPMMAQWEACKMQAGSAILFFRLGDFYEAFHNDAEIISKELDLILTKRQDVPMSGIPAHSAEGYIDRLVGRGYRVAVAEQVEDPLKVKGLVKREVVKVYSPGTLIDSALLTDKQYNFFISLSQIGQVFGLACLDLSCSDFRATEVFSIEDLQRELFRLNPKEVLVSDRFFQKHEKVLEMWKEESRFLLHTFDEWHFEDPITFNTLKNHFGIYTLDGFGLQGKNSAIRAAGALVSYFQEELAQPLNQVKSLSYWDPSDSLQIDSSTETHLELFETKSKLSLFEFLDKTSTPMGGRLLREWLKRPLIKIPEIERRQKSVEALLCYPCPLLELPHFLSPVRDLERLASKISTGNASPRDLLALARSLEAIPPLKSLLEQFSLPESLVKQALDKLQSLEEVKQRLVSTLSDPPPAKLQDGGAILDGFDPKLDEYRALSRDSQATLAAYQQKLRDETGIKTLKVGFNRAFGYFIEVSRGQADKMPSQFLRRQTLTTGERFTTEELKIFEEKLQSAEEKIREIEKNLFFELLNFVNPYLTPILENGRAVATIDALCSLATLAYRGQFVKPKVNESRQLKIKGGRHPVVEVLLGGAPFVPNDTDLNSDETRMAILTGPNMAGKSTYIRQVGLIVILAQMGSYVPAESAEIGVVDKLFTRIGAGDDLGRGQSTFMVEMAETASILNQATPRSLVILDEIGRGTSTFDGISIAWAVAEYLLTHPDKKAKTLFATHYFELTELEKTIQGAVNFHCAVKETPTGIVFLRKIIRGASDRSYGIHVAKLAGLPAEVIERAFEVLKKLEDSPRHVRKTPNPKRTTSNDQLLLF